MRLHGDPWQVGEEVLDPGLSPFQIVPRAHRMKEDIPFYPRTVGSSASSRQVCWRQASFRQTLAVPPPAEKTEYLCQCMPTLTGFTYRGLPCLAIALAKAGHPISSRPPINSGSSTCRSRILHSGAYTTHCSGCDKPPR
jgi:hypothetical protein